MSVVLHLSAGQGKRYRTFADPPPPFIFGDRASVIGVTPPPAVGFPRMSGRKKGLVPLDVDVFKQVDADNYQHLGKLITAADAKTSLLVPELKRFYVAVPKRNVAIPPTRDVIPEDAEVLVFEVP